MLAAVGASAQAADHYYLDVDMGAAFQPDANIQVSMFGNDGKVQFDTGFRGNVRLGYNFCEHFAAELESGVVWNPVVNFHSAAGDNEASALGYNADLYQIPILVNAIYRPFHGAFKPYLGVGVGGVAGHFDSSNIPLYAPNFSDTDFTFAYQGEAGVKYSIGHRTELGVAYEFLGTTDHNWSQNGYVLKTDGTMTHAVMATLTVRF